jgi:hypothetical protein
MDLLPHDLSGDPPDQKAAACKVGSLSDSLFGLVVLAA